MRVLLRHIIAAIWAHALLLSGGASAQGLTLETYLGQVDQSNPAAIAAKLRARALERRIDPSSTLDDPFFAVGPDEIPFGGGMGSVTRFQVSQSFPFPGRLGARGAAAEGRAKAADADAETTKRQIRVTAAQTFFRAFFNQEAIALNRKLRRILEDTAQSTKARYRTGDVGHHDWLLARVELSVLEVEKLRLERERRTLHAFLNELRNEAPEKDFGRVVVVRNGNGRSTDPAEPSLDDSPELKSIEAAVQSTDEERRLAKLSYLPDFVMQGMAMKPNSAMAEPSNWGVMVGISIPLYFWRKQSESLEAANLDVEAAVSEKRSLENRLRTEIVDAKQQLKTARDIVDFYGKAVLPNTQLAVSNAKSGYAARRLPLSQFLDVLKTQRTQELELLAADVAVWAGAIALVGVAVETSSIMIVYLDQTWKTWRERGALARSGDFAEATLEGASRSLRPVLMAVSMNIFGLVPVMVATGLGADVMKRISSPMFGGLLSLTILTLIVIPVVYRIREQRVFQKTARA